MFVSLLLTTPFFKKFLQWKNSNQFQRIITFTLSNYNKCIIYSMLKQRVVCLWHWTTYRIWQWQWTCLQKEFDWSRPLIALVYTFILNLCVSITNKKSIDTSVKRSTAYLLFFWSIHNLKYGQNCEDQPNIYNYILYAHVYLIYILIMCMKIIIKGSLR